MKHKIGTGIEVKLLVDFPIIKETLERIGIKNDRKKTFYPSCYCVQDEETGKYYVYHFKELFLLDGLESTFNQVDALRLKTIVYILTEWKLVETIDKIDEVLKDYIDIITKKQKDEEYKVIQKYKFKRTLSVSEKPKA